LGVAQLGRDLDVDLDDEIASASAMKRGESAAFDLQARPRLGSSGDADFVRFGHSGDFHGVPHRGLREGGFQNGEEGLAVSLETLVLLNADVDVEVSGGAARHAVMALAGDLHGVSVLHSGGNGDEDSGDLLGDALAVALLAGVGDGPAATSAGRAFDRGLHSADDGVLNSGNHARAFTGGTRGGRSAVFAAVAAAGGALGHAIDGDFFLDAFDDFLESKLDLDFDIAAVATHALATGLATGHAAEEHLEDIVKAAATLAAEERILGLVVSGTEAVKAGALFGVGQDAVGRADLFELLFRLVVTRIDVRVKLAGKPPVSGLDFVGRGIPRHA